MFVTGKGFEEWVAANRPQLGHYENVWSLDVPEGTSLEDLFELLPRERVEHAAYMFGSYKAAENAIQYLWMEGHREGKYNIPAWVFEKYLVEEYLQTEKININMIPPFPGNDFERWMDFADGYLLGKGVRRVGPWRNNEVRVLVAPTSLRYTEGEEVPSDSTAHVS